MNVYGRTNLHVHNYCRFHDWFGLIVIYCTGP
jgi:hypothetical protein